MTSTQQKVCGLSCRGMSCNTEPFLSHLFFLVLESGHLLHLVNDNINHRSNSIQMSRYRSHCDRKMFNHQSLDAVCNLPVFQLRIFLRSKLHVMDPRPYRAAHIHRGWTAKR